MHALLMNLEPISFERKTVIINELDEINEILFVNKGEVVVGFEINNQKKYCIRLRNQCVIGAYELNFGQRAKYVYTAFKRTHAYFIRKEKWTEITSDSPNVSKSLTVKIFYDHQLTVENRIITAKRKALKKLQKRRDVQMIKKLTEKSCSHCGCQNLRPEIDDDCCAQKTKQLFEEIECRLKNADELVHQFVNEIYLKDQMIKNMEEKIKDARKMKK